MQYDYTGSNSFFEQMEHHMTMVEAQTQGQNPVKEAQDVRAYMRYKF